MPPPDACLFDLDGLLLDTEPCHGQAWSQAAARFGLTLTERQVFELRGRRRADCVALVRGWIAAADLMVPDPAALLAVQQPIARRLLPGAPAMDGAAELLGRCRSLAVPMAMVTSSAREAVALKVAPHPWLAVIELRILGDDHELAAGKPAPDPYLLAARRLGLDPGRCWAFEDSLAGALSARSAGCRVHVLLPPGATAASYPAGVRILRSLRDVCLEEGDPAGLP